jgi:hypothetical protein
MTFASTIVSENLQVVHSLFLVNRLNMIVKLALFHGVIVDKPNQQCMPVYPRNLIGSKGRHVLKAERGQALLFAASPPRLGRGPRLRGGPRKEYLRKNTHIVFHSLSD